MNGRTILYAKRKYASANMQARAFSTRPFVYAWLWDHGNNAPRRMLQWKWEKLAFIREACLKMTNRQYNVLVPETGKRSLLYLKRNVQWCVCNSVNAVEHLVARKIRYANASPWARVVKEVWSQQLWEDLAQFEVFHLSSRNMETF